MKEMMPTIGYFITEYYFAAVSTSVQTYLCTEADDVLEDVVVVVLQFVAHSASPPLSAHSPQL